MERITNAFIYIQKIITIKLMVTFNIFATSIDAASLAFQPLSVNIENRQV